MLTVDGLYYEIGFHLPKVKGDFSGESTWRETGGCKDETRVVNMPKADWTFD